MRRRDTSAVSRKRILLVGNPNVGKSMLFRKLTNVYAAVSNYPGTTVEIFSGCAELSGLALEVIDTPGMYSLVSLSEEERVSRDIILKNDFDLLVNVLDARNCLRMLPLTLELVAMGLPVVCVLNMADEAEAEGVIINTDQLGRELGVPCVLSSMVTGLGVAELKKLIRERLVKEELQTDCPSVYPDHFRKSFMELRELLAAQTGFSSALKQKKTAFLLMRSDSGLLESIRQQNQALAAMIEEKLSQNGYGKDDEHGYACALQLHETAAALTRRCGTLREKKTRFRDRLDLFLLHPVPGFFVLAIVLYVGLYLFTGVVGAGLVVSFLEKDVMDAAVIPFLSGLVRQIIPWEALQDLFTGDFGLITLGLKYALAIIFPIVLFFFIVFSILEDSGYLPRLAMLLDRTLKKIGLSGRAVIPMVLGLGCDTMATLVTRILPTRRERFIATFLLALAVPCSAQLGVMLALLAPNAAALVIWLSAVVIIFLAAGSLSARLIPGKRPVFYMELPPLRFPSPANVAIKTFVRLQWYLKEIIPIFLLGSVILWILKYSGLLAVIESGLQYPVMLLGLPKESAFVFLLGFFRRDFGSAGLYLLVRQGALSGNQLLVACVALTLFLPCIAQFFINIKERGLKQGLLISGMVLVISFSAAALLNQLLILLGVRL